MSRLSFLTRALAIGGTIAVGGVLINGLPKMALGAPSASQDGDILNFALLLEYLEAGFYTEAVNGGALTGETLAFAKTVRKHEQAHVDFLKSALGSAALADSALGGSILAGSLATEGSSVPGWPGLPDRLSLRPSGPRSIAAWAGALASSDGSPGRAWRFRDCRGPSPGAAPSSGRAASCAGAFRFFRPWRSA